MTPLLLRQVRVVDPVAGAAGERRVDVLCVDGRFAAIAPSVAAGERAEARAGGRAGERAEARADERAEARAEVIDGRGRFALPGLIDCHCHVCGFFLPDLPRARDLAWIPSQIDLNLRAALRSGVTTVRDMMAPLRHVLRLRARAERPGSGWPRLVCAGPMLTVRGGYPAFVPRDTWIGRAILGPLRAEARDGREAATWVERIADAGADWIKVGYSSRGYDAAATPLALPSDAAMRAIAEAARRRGLRVAVHHSWLADLRRLVELPFDTLEHLTLDAEIDDALADRIAARGLPITTNLEVFAFVDRAGEHLAAVEGGRAPLVPAARRGMAAMLRDVAAGRNPNPHFDIMSLRGSAARMARNLARLARRGVLLGAATDAGTNLVHGRLPDEIVHIVRAGLSPAAALRAATTDAARLLGLDDIGRLAAGARADLVLYDADPLADVEVVRRPSLVIHGGAVVAA